MKRIAIISLAVLTTLLTVTNGFAWSRMGHAAVAYIAERNLTPKAKANVEACIGGNSIVYYASWLDYYRKYFKAWDKRAHVCTYYIDDMQPYGKAVANLNESISKLRNYRNLSDSARLFHIYCLIHTVGDFHCPGHVSLMSRDGDKSKSLYSSHVQINYKGKPLSYHKFWDGVLVKDLHPDWGYMEFGEELDRMTQAEKDALTAGTVEEWLHEIAVRSRCIFDGFPPSPKGTPLSELPVMERDRLYDFGELAQEQIVRGGLRLAKVLNELFEN